MNADELVEAISKFDDRNKIIIASSPTEDWEILSIYEAEGSVCIDIQKKGAKPIKQKFSACCGSPIKELHYLHCPKVRRKER